MGFWKVDEMALDRALELGCNAENAIEFGSQDFWYLNENGELITPKSQDERKSVADIFKNKGFANYSCIDLDGAHGAYRFNINYDFEQKYGFDKKFDYVGVHGILPSCFDQKTFLKNAHSITKAGGFLEIEAHLCASDVSSGFYYYSPYSVLKFGLTNGYILRGAWVWAQDYLRGNHGAAIDKRIPLLRDLGSDLKKIEPLVLESIRELRKDHQNFGGGSGYNAEDYGKESENKFGREISFFLTLLWQKASDSEFITPSTFCGDMVSAAAARAWVCIANGIFPRNVKKVAIFGSGESAKIASSFARSAGIEILGFVDDFKSGQYLGAKIINWDTFCARQNEVDALICGYWQKGIEQERAGLKVPLIRLEEKYFV